jgi:SNF2 family DNA or RNA helicase
MHDVKNWQVVGSFVVDSTKASENQFVPALDFWNERINDSESGIGLHIASIGHLELVVDRESSQLSLRVLADEVTELLNPKIGMPFDHVVLSGYWVPINEEETAKYLKFLNDYELSLGMEVDFENYLKLISGRNKFNLRIDLPSGYTFLESDLKIQSSNYKLALEPYPYQKRGIDWLTSLRKYNVGGILGDEMGLGKTVQLLGLIDAEFRNNPESRVLVIVPSSLKLNWLEEFKKFTPSHPVFVHGGRHRDSMPSKIASNKIVLTTYEILFRDENILQQIKWDLVICDEAHGMKNPDSRRRKSMSGFKNVPIFCSTGTPVENNLLDLWSLIDLIRPGLMGSRGQLKSAMIDQLQDAADIGETVRPLILRRVVENVLPDLPPVIEKVHWLQPSKEFVSGYDQIRSVGLGANSHKMRLGVINKLRQYCAYPPLVTSELVEESDQKILVLEAILDEIQIQDEKVIIFTSWHSSADMLYSLLRRDYPDTYSAIIDGRDASDVRFPVIENFKKINGFAILICNTRAAGEGLNITAANHVVHFDRQWNPAKEAQANARAHRIGQEKTVFIHKLIYKDTIEELIDDKLLLKSHLADETLAASEMEADDKSLHEALQIKPTYTDEGE